MSENCVCRRRRRRVYALWKIVNMCAQRDGFSVFHFSFHAFLSTFTLLATAERRGIPCIWSPKAALFFAIVIEFSMALSRSAKIGLYINTYRIRTPYGRNYSPCQGQNM